MPSFDPNSLRQLEEIQLRVLYLLVEGATVATAAESLGIGADRINGWYATDPLFRAAAERLLQIRASVVSRVLQPEPGSRVLITWYRREDYPFMLALVPDPQNFAPDWDTWHQNVSRECEAAEELGYEIVRVIVDPIHFQAWCRQRNRPFDSAARVEYCAEHAGQPPAAHHA